MSTPNKLPESLAREALDFVRLLQARELNLRQVKLLAARFRVPMEALAG